MMRNAWHISGGEGWCANTSNRRVLVTHNDGSQSVEEIKNDLGVKVDTLLFFGISRPFLVGVCCVRVGFQTDRLVNR
jgi:hypothetical protein